MTEEQVTELRVAMGSNAWFELQRSAWKAGRTNVQEIKLRKLGPAAPAEKTSARAAT